MCVRGWTLAPAFAASVLEEARNEIKRLESAVASRQSLLDIKEQELEGLKEQMQVRDAEHKEELVQLRMQMGHGQLQHLQENVDLIKLHREVKSQSTRETALQNEIQDLRTQLQKISASHGSALKEVELVTSELKSEQEKNRELQDKLSASELTKQTIPELEECIKDLQRENDILKEANNKLLESIEEVDNAFCHTDVEDSLRARVAQLEAVVNSDAEGKKELLLQVALHKEACSNLSCKYEELQKQHTALIHEDEQLKAKVSLLEQESRALHEELHASRIREAQMRESVTLATKEQQAGMEQASTQTDHGDQEDMASLTGQKNSKVNALKELQEDVLQKNTEIQKMERKIKHILQKSQHVRIAEVRPPEESDSDTYGSLLHKGQSFFEIHISRVLFTSEEFHPSKDSSLFVRWAFADFEPQATPAASSDWPEFNCTARYAIDVSREFLEFLEKGSVKLELQEVFGVNERPLGVSELSLKSSLKNAFKRHRVRSPLLGTCNGKVVLGALCGWTRFLPTPEAASQFLGVTAPVPIIRDHREQVIEQRRERESEDDASLNVLHVEIMKCSALPQPNDSSSLRYCQYSLYHSPYQNTNAVPSSETVEFQDHRNFPLKMDSRLHTYLLNTNLDVFIFDTSDHDPGSYIGRACIGLAPLTTGAEIKGSFSFFNVHSENVGYVEVFLHWENEYKAHLQPLLKARPMHRTSRHSHATSGSFQSKLHVPKCSSAPSRSQQHWLKLMRPSTAAVGTKDPRKQAPSHHPHRKPYSPEASSLTSVSSISSHEAKDIASSERPSADESSSRDNAATDPKLSISVGECQNGNEESDSSRDVVIRSPPRKQIALEPSDVAVFSINSLVFLPGAAVLKDKSVEMLFVEFHFLDCPPAELETPFSLPKMKPPQRAVFNFRKVVHLDTKNHASRRELLSALVTSKATSATITFTIVSEPSNNSDKAECKDIGTATADLKQILKSGRDIVEEDVAVLSCTNKRPIGRLNISVEILAALRSILACHAPPSK
ncbi:protein fantom-like isoform X2 [Ornithodoros turicata]|uniref:protein fantom-like isoform X2 n=1 Tax=Ornithodoros turicata TaxID=34597 RepID=UPI0031398EAE